MSEAERITETARALARLDVSTSLALLAADRVRTPHLCSILSTSVSDEL